MSEKLWEKVFKSSTLEFIREAKRKPGYSLFDLLHGYVYIRWPYLYIGIGTGEHPLAKRYRALFGLLGHWLDTRLLANKKNGEPVSNGKQRISYADTYHGKVVPLESAKKLVMVQEDIRLPDLERVIPYELAREIVLQNPDHIAVLECPCRSARPDPCLPLDVCLIVGEPFAGFVIEHHPQRARWIDQQEAVQILQEEDERGHVHHAFFKDAMLGRFYAICNCCACCCGAMQAQRNGVPMLASSGYVSQVDEDLCIACELCADICQFGALSVPNGSAMVDREVCMGCGVCVQHCVQEALSLVRDPRKGEPLEICELMESMAT